MSKLISITGLSKQRGIALVSSLVIMLILTILGITVMNMTTLEEKMAFNTQDRYLARYLAESSILFMARDDENLPNPEQPGFSHNNNDSNGNNDFDDLPDLLPDMGIDAGGGQIIYTQSTPVINLPMTSPKATYVFGGATLDEDTQLSPNDGIPIFLFAVSLSTKAGTIADNARSSYYFIPISEITN
jgi:type IV pilus assembly protein PilX